MPEYKVHVELVTFRDFRGNGNYKIQSVGLSDLEIQGERITNDLDSLEIRDTQVNEKTEEVAVVDNSDDQQQCDGQGYLYNTDEAGHNLTELSEPVTDTDLTPEDTDSATVEPQAQYQEPYEDWTQEDYAAYYGDYDTGSKPYEEWTQEDYEMYYRDLEIRPVTACRLSTIPEETEDDVICS